MYGFHKIPHIQSGALRPDDPSAETVAEFAHPWFVRGMPEMLQYVTRKRAKDDRSAIGAVAAAAMGGTGPLGGASVPGLESVADSSAGSAQSRTAPASSAAPPLQTPPLPLSTLLADLSYLKRHALSLSTDLTSLRRDNTALWSELRTLRDQNARQGELVERVVGFLRGV
ncbi:stress-responsive transcription factor hsf1, partial [Gonapodya sp. JEL0774]